MLRHVPRLSPGRQWAPLAHECAGMRALPSGCTSRTSIAALPVGTTMPFPVGCSEVRQTFKRWPRMGRPRAAEPDESVHVDRRRSPVQVQLGGIDLAGVDGLAHLRLGLPEPVVERVENQPGPDVDEHGPKLVGGRVDADLDLLSPVDRTGVESFLDVHHAHTGHLVAGEDRPFHRRGPAPSRQQREVDVDHPKLGEDVRPDEPAEGDDDAELRGRVEVEHVVDAVRDREPQLDGRGLDRRGNERASSPPSLVCSTDHERNVVSGLDDRTQRRHCHRRCAEVGEPQRS